MDREDQKTKDERVEKLWHTLDTRKEGQLNLQGLQKGLGIIDHPLKNADSLLQDILKAVDTDGDGYIQYSEFRKFVEQTEKELWQLFKSIDRDQNGQLDKDELMAAFVRAGLVISNSKLDRFFSEVDTNHDGVISFDEWRDFLLFLPSSSPNLRAVLSYYSSTVTLNAEGDVHVSRDSTEGLGRNRFPTAFFGVITKILKPPPSKSPSRGISPPINEAHAPLPTTEIQPNTFPWDPGDLSPDMPEVPQSAIPIETETPSKKEGLLTGLLPHPGYFLSGGIAGVVSRTATAPLDRLKVYLIAQTGVKQETVQAIKEGAPVQAAKKASRPLAEAGRALWRMGGIRSLFAGNGLNVIKVMPESAIKFGSYEGSKIALAKLEGHGDPKNLKPWTQFFAAGMGGIISQFCIYPLDTLKFRMQCETVEGGLHGNALILATTRKMWRTTGIRSFYRGLPMGLVGMFPYSAIDLSTFEYLKRFLTHRNALARHCHEDDAAPGNVMTASIGAVSGALGASVVYPINVLRTRLQSQGTAIHPPTYDGMWDVAVKTVKGEGVRGLFKGITPNLLKVVPAVSITYVVYENSKRILGLN